MGAPFEDAVLEHQQALLQEDDVGRFLGDVHRGIDGDAHVRRLHRRRVVDAVAHEPDHVPAALESADDVVLLRRRQPGEHVCRSRQLGELRFREAAQLIAGHEPLHREPHVAADLLRDQRVVAGEDLGGHPVLAQRLQGRDRGLLGRIEEGEVP